MRYSQKILIPLIIISFGCGANTYDTRLRQSQSFINNRQYDRAKTEVMKLINEYPEKPEPYYLLGLINYAGKKYGESLVNFDRAERYGLTTSHEFYLYKGISLYNTGDLVGAEKNLSMSTAARSTGNAQKYLGMVRYKLGDYAGSVDAFRESSSMENDARILQMFGMALYHSGMNEESLDIFMKAYNLEPDDEEITFQTANMLMLNGINDEAITLYSKIPSGSKYLNESKYNQAEAYIRIEDYESAVSFLKNYVEERPDDYDALYNLASVYIKTKEFVSAADILSSLISDEKYRIGASYNLGLVNYKLGKYAESIFYLSKVVDHAPENVQYRYAYGLSLSENGDFDKAREQMNAILSLDPGNADAHEWLYQNPPIEQPPREPGRYYNDEYGFSIEVPDEYEIETVDGNTVYVYFYRGDDSEDVSCEHVYVGIQKLPVRMGLDEYYEEIMKVMPEQMPGFQLHENSQIKIDNNAAKWILFTVNFKDLKIEGKALTYFLVKDDMAYGITFGSSINKFSGLRSTFEEAAKSFRFE